MNTLLKTMLFDNWLASLRDGKAKIKIVRRIERARQGNFGDHKNVGGPIWEMRVDYGPGYRLYYAQKGSVVYVRRGQVFTTVGYQVRHRNMEANQWIAN